jgi:hypothetical protein
MANADYLLFPRQGRFEILSLSGTIFVMDIGGQRTRTGGLNVSLAGPDGRLLGGGVAGLLIAASPIQVLFFCPAVIPSLLLETIPCCRKFLLWV